MHPNTVAISRAAHLQYLLITVKVVALEKVSFIDTQNPVFSFLKSIFNFKHLPEKDDPHG